jgi:diguanylate cyclase (GGDEF)-like protein
VIDMPQLPATDSTSRGGASLLLVCGLLGLAFLAMIAVTAEYLVAVSARVWMANAGWLISSIVALIGVGVVRRRSAPRDRGGWALLESACRAWMIGELLWILYGLTHYPASPNAADICWLAFAVVAAVGVIRLGSGARGRSVSWLELTPLAVAVCALLGAVLWTEVATSTLAAPGAATALAYSALSSFTALVMLQSVVTGTLDVRANPGMALVLIGLVVDAMAFALWTPLLLDATYTAGTNPIDAMWTVGMLLVGIGAAVSTPPTCSPDVERVSERRGALLPVGTFAILAAMQALVILTDAPGGAALLLTLGMVITGGTLAARGSRLRRGQAVLNERLKQSELALRATNERLNEESRRDPLTSLANRLRLDEDLAQLSAWAERDDRTYCLVIFDLDRFKAYNDAFGHQAGDDALRRVATLLDQTARAGDRVYRYGGEELVLLLSDQDADAGADVAERYRASVEDAAIPHPLNQPSQVITLSAGVAAVRPRESSADVLRRADEALYRAKAAGRNRITVADTDPTAGSTASVTK